MDFEFDERTFRSPAAHRALLRLHVPDEIELRSFRRRLVRLTPREQQTLYLLVEGFTNKEVARFMKISHRTVEVHRSRLYDKLGGVPMPYIVKCLILLRIEIDAKPRSAILH